MIRRFGDRAGLDGGVGEHVLDVEHQRAAARPGDAPTRSARASAAATSRARASTRRPPAGSDRRHAGERGEPGEAERRGARRLRLSAPGNGWTRVIEPHARLLAAHQPAGPARLDAVVRYQGSAVTTCSSWPRAASSATMRVITSPVGAVSGAKCGHRTASRSGRRGSAAARSPAARRHGRRSSSAARRAPRRERAGPRPAGGDERVAVGAATSSRASRPGVERRAAGAAPASPTTSGSAVAVAADHRRAERHRLEHGRAEALVAAREHQRVGHRSSPSRSASGTRPGRITRSPSSRRSIARRRRPRRAPRRRAAPARRSGSVHGRGEQVEQEAVVLVRVGDRRVARAPARRRARSGPAARRRRLASPASGRLEAVRHDHDAVRVDAVGVERRCWRTNSLGTATTSARRDRAGHRAPQVAPLDGDEVLRESRYWRSWTVSTTGRPPAAATVPPPWWTSVGDAGAPAAPATVRSADAPGGAGRRPSTGAHDELDAVGQLGVGGGEARAATNSRDVDAPARRSAGRRSWRARYSSEPPTRPGTHHSRLTPTCRRASPAPPPGRPRRVSVGRGGPRAAARPARGPAARQLGAARRAASTMPRAMSATSSGSTSTAAPPATSSVAVPPAGDHRRALGHRLQHRQPEPLAQARVAEHVGARRTAAGRSSLGTKPRKRTSPARRSPGASSPHPRARRRPAAAGRARRADRRRPGGCRFLRGSRVPTNSRYRSGSRVAGGAPRRRRRRRPAHGSTPSGTSRSRSAVDAGGDAVVQRGLATSTAPGRRCSPDATPGCAGQHADPVAGEVARARGRKARSWTRHDERARRCGHGTMRRWRGRRRPARSPARPAGRPSAPPRLVEPGRRGSGELGDGDRRRERRGRRSTVAAGDADQLDLRRARRQRAGDLERGDGRAARHPCQHCSRV